MTPRHIQQPNETLRQENRVLRGLLQSLGQDARHNQQVLQRFQERELTLLSADDLVRLLECLTDGMRASFTLDSVKLKLLDPCFVIRDLLVGHSDADTHLMRDIELCTDVRETHARFTDPDNPWLGAWDEALHLPLFRRRLNGSVALLPLAHTEGLAGYLCLGSRDPGRFETHQIPEISDEASFLEAAARFAPDSNIKLGGG